jgi:hypothetical protein
LDRSIRTRPSRLTSKPVARASAICYLKSNGGSGWAFARNPDSTAARSLARQNRGLVHSKCI